MKVYTFFEKLDGDRWPDAEEMLALWKRNWSFYGWEPVVLSLKDCARHRDFDRLLAHVKNVPTVNPRRYSTVNFLRWLPMTELGGYMIDYDVLNYGWTPEPVDRLTALGSPGWWGMCIGGRPEDFRRVVGWFFERKLHSWNVDGAPHVSISTIMSKHGNEFDYRNIEVTYRQRPAWETSLLVHYARFWTGPDRLKVMKTARPFCAVARCVTRRVI